MRTWLHGNIWIPKKRTNGIVTYLSSIVSNSVEPGLHEEAMHQPQWKEAMDIESVALQKNKTWHLMSPKLGLNVIDSKWGFKLKRRADGTID